MCWRLHWKNKHKKEKAVAVDKAVAFHQPILSTSSSFSEYILGLVQILLRDKTTVFFDLTQAELVNLSVFDGQGRLLQVVLHDAKMEKGRYQIPIRLFVSDGGVYYVHLQTEGGKS